MEVLLVIKAGRLAFQLVLPTGIRIVQRHTTHCGGTNGAQTNRSQYAKCKDTLSEVSFFVKHPKQEITLSISSLFVHFTKSFLGQDYERNAMVTVGK